MIAILIYWEAHEKKILALFCFIFGVGLNAVVTTGTPGRVAKMFKGVKRHSLYLSEC